jgi:hypothetical protein
MGGGRKLRRVQLCNVCWLPSTYTHPAVATDITPKGALRTTHLIATYLSCTPQVVQRSAGVPGGQRGGGAPKLKRVQLGCLCWLLVTYTQL